MNRLSKFILIAFALCLLTALIQQVQIYSLEKQAEPLIHELQNSHWQKDAFTEAAIGVVAGVKKNYVGAAVAVWKVGVGLWAGFGRSAEIKRRLGEIATYHHTLSWWRDSALFAACALGAVAFVRHRRTKKPNASFAAS